ncbi:MAG: archaeosortase/exosortase family protein [Thermodesulfobacteriota bacterium]|nr:archaeosortase/exosortase family protein [Thermodesulfobacteriota bacterium]
MDIPILFHFEKQQLLLWIVEFQEDKSKFSIHKLLRYTTDKAPVAILLNIVRLTFTAILASMYGGEVAQGFLHEMSGFVTFGLGLIMLLSISRILTSKIK